MALRALFHLASNYVKRFRGVPVAYLRFPKNFKPHRTIVQRAAKTRISLFSRFIRSFGNPNSLARNIQRSALASSSHIRPNSLIRAYSGLAGSVQLRHQLTFSTEFSLTAINELSKQREGSWFGGFLSSLNRYPALPNLINTSASLIPKELIGTGCNSAVWSAEVATTETANEHHSDDRTNNELAVKVLYNYYASVNPDLSLQNTDCRSSLKPLDVASSVDWVLLHRQLERECELRPSTGHPNIVPLVGHFLDRAPTSTIQTGAHVELITDRNHIACQNSQSDSFTVPSPSSSTDLHESPTEPGECNLSPRPTWVGADSFPEGFGGQPLTYYLLMPKFSATLEDLLNGTWDPAMDVCSDPKSVPAQSSLAFRNGDTSKRSSLNSGSGSVSCIIRRDVRSIDTCSTLPSPVEGLQTGIADLPKPSAASLGTRSRRVVDVDEGVAILAQLFDAVAELERLGVAHRDIKPNNILLRPRPPLNAAQKASVRCAQLSRCPDSTSHSWLDENEVLSTNTRFHVAITDFGCATRTVQKVPLDLQSSFLKFIGHMCNSDVISSKPDVFTHSGNTMLLAPEITTKLRLDEPDSNSAISQTPLDYSRADLWSVATLVYSLFGRNNPFIDGTLSSATYDEGELPDLLDGSPGIVSWILTHCLRRDPSTRPPADLVADVLHTWCLLRHSHRRKQRNRTTAGLDSTGHQLDDTIETELMDRHLTNELEYLTQLERPPRVNNQLRTFLNVCWAADWLTGPARPPDGLRVSFYRRVTLDRLAMCMRIVNREEAARAGRITSSIAAAMESMKLSTPLVNSSP